MVKVWLLRLFSVLFFWIWWIANPVRAQEIQPLSDFTVQVDTQLVRYSSDRFRISDRWVLPFTYRQRNARIQLRLETPLSDPDTDLEILKGSDYVIIDSLIALSDNVWQVNIRCPDLSRIDLLQVNFKAITSSGSESLLPLYLYPYVIPKVQWRVGDDELYIGEEKAYELNGQHLDQLEANNLWENGQGFEYRLRATEDRLRVFLLARQTGTYEIKIPLKTRRFYKVGPGKYTQEVPALIQKFQVKVGRLVFLALDRTEIIAENGIGQPIEVQIDRARYLPVKKTFRIESQQDPGGTLVAELFTRNMLANDRMLCWLRPYGYHRLSEGYLYVKDGDDTRFITNFNLIEKASVNKVMVMREGSDWSENLAVFPGERFDIRLEGNGLQRSRFNLEGVEEWTKDSTVSTDQMAVYHVRLPQDFNKKKIAVLLNKRVTGFELNVREYQNPRPFDFISIDFGNGYQPITSINKPVLYPNTLQNIVLRFSPEGIESANRFYGKQYLTVDINLYNNRKELIEYKKLENVVVCPGENSIRFPYYDHRDCNPAEISLNNQMVRKTQDLPDWGRVEITVRTNQMRYNSVGYSHKLEVIQKRQYSFDIDVSFPAGLIIKKVGEKGLGNLSGISTAIVGQFGFYRPDKIEKFYPFRVGAGFIALNAFNFNENSNRDVGLVALASVFPTKMTSRFSFPLYLGFGYLLKDAQWFYILGPGIQVRF